MAHRNVKASSLRSNSVAEDDVDPMSGLANLADVMLVFACGLMLAVVAYWQVDITPDLTEVTESENMEEVQDDIEEAESALSSGSGYDRLGVVYQDPTTGKMYMISEGDESGEDDSQTTSSADSDGQESSE
jgi:hypothetical protein